MEENTNSSKYKNTKLQTHQNTKGQIQIANYKYDKIQMQHNTYETKYKKNKI